MTTATVATPTTAPVSIRPVSALGGYAAKQCAERIRRDNHPAYLDVVQDEPSAAARMRMADGVDFENAVEQHLKGALRPDDLFLVPACDRSVRSKRAREQATLAAMDAGARFIWNARLPAADHRIAEPDFLVRVGDRPVAGKWRYAPGDVKHHRSLTGSAKPRPWRSAPMASPWLEGTVAALGAAGLPRLDDSMQLAHYHRILESFGYHQTGDSIWGAVIGKDLRLLWRDLNEPLHLHSAADGTRRRHSALEIYDLEFATRLQVAVEAAAGSDPTVSLALKPECGDCPWRSSCRADLDAADHITLLAGVTELRATAHQAAGVTTRAQVAALDAATAAVVDTKVPLGDIDPKAPKRSLIGDHLELTDAQAAALAAAGVRTVGDVRKLDTTTLLYLGSGVWRLVETIDRARVVASGVPHRARGISEVAVPRADVEIDVDMENAPDGTIYLWGLHVLRHHKNGRRSTRFSPHHSWVGTSRSEGLVFARFWKDLTGLVAKAQAKDQSVAVYHYTAAEDRCLRALAERHSGVPGVPTLEEVDAFIASDVWVDLHPIVGERVIWPTEDQTLKSIAKQCGFSWRDKSPSGAESLVWYQQATSHGSKSVRDANKARLLAYNEDDNRATVAVRDWLALNGPNLSGVESLGT